MAADSLWQIVIAGASAVVGAMTGAGTLLWRVAKMTGRLEELGTKVDRHEKLIDTLIEKNDVRHEANLREFRTLGETVAKLPDTIVQRVEGLLRKRE